MKIFSLLIFCSLIAFIFNTQNSLCYPDYRNGDVSVGICSRVTPSYEGNECCMITYTDTADTVYKVCYEMDAKRLIHFDYYKSEIKNIIDSIYGATSTVRSIDYYTCSSGFIKFSFLALLLILF